MKRTWVVAVIFAGTVAGQTFAGDMPAPNWSGVYVGANVGYSWGNPSTDVTGSGTAPANLVVGPGLPPYFLFNFAFADSNSVRLKGATGGGQIGYNFQLGTKWVLGFEADWQSSGQSGSNSFVDQLSAPLCVAAEFLPPRCSGNTPWSSTATTGYQAKIGWFSTARARAGFLVTDQILLYGTAGLAFGRVEVSGNSFPASIANSVALGSQSIIPMGTAFDVAKNNVGYAVGAGVEGKLTPWLPTNWSWKLEYLYLDLGSVASGGTFNGLASTFAGLPAFQPSPLFGAVALNTHFTDNIMRVGLNYKFGN
jgi:outer membrane immunogenic protein